MKITKLQRAVKNKNNINIFLDDQYWISIHEKYVLDYKIYNGYIIDENLKKELENLMSEQKLLLRLQRFILLRPRSIFELKTYIRTKLDITDKTETDRLIAMLNIQDDLPFAEWFIETLNHSKKAGKNKVVAKLKMKGVSSEIIKRAFDKISWEQDTDEIVRKAKLGIRETDPNKYKIKLTRRLLSKGLSYDEIKKVI